MKTELFSPAATAEFSKFAGILSAALSKQHLKELSGGTIPSTHFIYSNASLDTLDFILKDVWL